MTFPPGEKFANVALRIYNDQVAESTETLFLNLEIPAVSAAIGVYKVSPDNATVSIIDDDGKCCFSAPYSSEHNQDIVHLHNCLPELTGCVIFISLDWPIKYDKGLY